MTVELIAYDTAHPGDTRELERHLQRFEPARIRRLALPVKTEGNSEINDYSREYAMQSASLALGKHGGERLLERSTFLFSTGCEGAMTPFGYLFVDLDEPGALASRPRALAMGCARSRSLAPEEIRPGDSVAVLHEIYEYPSWYWCSDPAFGNREEMIRLRTIPRDEAIPLQVESVCLPFVLVRRPCGRHATLDVRRSRVAKLDAGYAKAAAKAYRRGLKKRRGRSGPDSTDNL